MNERALKAATAKTAIERALQADPRQAPRQPIGHVLKTHPQQFQDIIEGGKCFEVRKDDRDFARGDTVVLVEFDPATRQHTGRSTTRTIGYLGRGAPYPAGFCAFQLDYGEANAPTMAQQVGRLR